MNYRKVWIPAALGIALALPAWSSLEAQRLPLEPLRPRGLAVSPVFEGWYQNTDGTITLSYGYLNRNTEEIVDVPVGPSNYVSPGAEDQGQPTHFLTRRHYGWFTVTVPGDFGPEERVTWTIDIRGQEFAIPGGTLAGYEIDALYAPALEETPPVLVLEEGGPEARGPNGHWTGPLSATVGEPLALSASAWSEDEEAPGVTLRWYEYRGPGEVSFSEATTPVDEETGSASTEATFTEPGDYVVYVRANYSNTSLSGSGQEQCCWTNGYYEVSVEE